MARTFRRDILPLFRPIDIDHMRPRGVLLGEVSWMTDPANDHANARLVSDRLSDGSMPPDSPWDQSRLDLYQEWMTEGYQP